MPPRKERQNHAGQNHAAEGLCTSLTRHSVSRVVRELAATGRRFADLVFAHQRYVSFGQLISDLELIAKATDPAYGGILLWLLSALRESALPG